MSCHLEEDFNPLPVAQRAGGTPNIMSAGFSRHPNVATLWSWREIGT